MEKEKKINIVSVERMNNGAHFLFVSNVLDRAEADVVVRPKLAAELQSLRTAVDQEDACLSLSRKNLLTDEIVKGDADRSAAYRGYKGAVKSYCRLSHPDLKLTAKVLWQHILDYGINPRMQLDRETGLLINFIDDLEGKYAEEVEKLHLMPMVAALKEANERVRSFTLQRTNERMNVVVGAMKLARKASDKAYRALVGKVNALAIVEGPADYADFIDYVNTEIQHYKREVI